MANRDTEIGAIWADGAPNAPASPVSGTTYAKSTISAAEIQNGQPFDELGDAAKWNEILKRITTLAILSEQYGILPWSPLTTYPVGAWAMGSDGNAYKCTVSNINNDPVTTSGFWIDALRPSTESYAGLIQLATQATVNAGTNDTQAITPLKLAVRLVALLTNTALLGVPTCPTASPGTSTSQVASTAFATAAANASALNGLVMSSWTSFIANAIPPWTGTAYCAQITRNGSVVGHAYKIHMTRPIAGGTMSSSIIGVPAAYVPASTKTIKSVVKMETSPVYTDPEITRDVSLGALGYFQIVGSRDTAGTYAHSFDLETVLWV